MPRFMGSVRMEEGVGSPPEALFTAMDAYIAEQAQQGHFLDGDGLFGTEDAVNFVVRTGETTRVDGPYAEAKGVVGGWSLLEYDSLALRVRATGRRSDPGDPLSRPRPRRRPGSGRAGECPRDLAHQSWVMA